MPSFKTVLLFFHLLFHVIIFPLCCPTTASSDTAPNVTQPQASPHFHQFREGDVISSIGSLPKEISPIGLMIYKDHIPQRL